MMPLMLFRPSHTHIYTFASFQTFRSIYSVLNNTSPWWHLCLFLKITYTHRCINTHIYSGMKKKQLSERYLNISQNFLIGFAFRLRVCVCVCLVVDSVFARRAQELCSGGKHQQEKMSRCVKSASLPLSSWSADESLQREISPSRNSRDWARCELHRDTAMRDKDEMSVTLKPWLGECSRNRQFTHVSGHLLIKSLETPFILWVFLFYTF